MVFKHIAYIGIGSNVGDRVGNCHKAVSALSDDQGCRVDGCSPFYETEPVGFEDQPWFVNGVVRVQTVLGPEALFARLKKIEQGMGREEGGVKFGPRVIDMDILFFDDLVLRAGYLEIPHPRAHERGFVLQPLSDLTPDLVHPILGRPIRTLLNLLTEEKKVTLLS